MTEPSEDTAKIQTVRIKNGGYRISLKQASAFIAVLLGIGALVTFVNTQIIVPQLMQMCGRMVDEELKHHSSTSHPTSLTKKEFQQHAARQVHRQERLEDKVDRILEKVK